VLLVEDEAALQEAARMKLEKVGISVISATTGEEGLKILETTRPTLVWLDLLLPGMNGLEVLRGIRSDPKNADLPVIVVSVSGGEEKIKRAFALNAVDYLVKSQYTIEDIVKHVKDIVDTLTAHV
jgi:two-component system alkaline phosphatase synthesis response regulator PhoP